MTIGVPEEIKIGETRVWMTPSLWCRCVSLGARGLIQKAAGITAGFTDAEYRAAGAMLVRKGVERALAGHQGLQRGVNTEVGKIAYPAVAKALGYAS